MRNRPSSAVLSRWAGAATLSLLAGVLTAPGPGSDQGTIPVLVQSPGTATHQSAATQPVASPAAVPVWVGTWASVPTAVPPGNITVYEKQTIRQVVHTSLGGDSIRVRLTNEFGEQPLAIGRVRVARHAAGAPGQEIVAGTDRPVTFSGGTSVTVPAGAPVLSDPVPLSLPAGSDLAVSLYLPERTPVTTVHNYAHQLNVVASGDVTRDRALTATSTIDRWCFLGSVDVRTNRRAAESVLAFGDSITDGANTVQGANHRWPDLLAERFRWRAGTSRLGVLNEAITGNRLLHDPNPPAGSDAEGYADFFGQSALRRFDRDISAQTGVGHVIVLLGINDIGQPGGPAPASEQVGAKEVIAAHRQLIARARAQGLKIYGGTLTPFKDDTLGFYSPRREADRKKVNRWIRTSGEYDAFIDFEAAVRDPRQPDRMLAAYDSGDHLHPNDAGMQAMADAVPLGLFL
jgi:lysophospholipase L1-like esterase